MTKKFKNIENELKFFKEKYPSLNEDYEETAIELGCLKDQNQIVCQMKKDLENEKRFINEEMDLLRNDNKELVNQNQELINKLSILSEKMRGFNELYDDFTRSREEEKENIRNIKSKNIVI